MSWMAADRVNAISGYREYWSVITRTYWLFGKGALKSVSTVLHGRCGSYVILAGSLGWEFVEIWRLKHPCTVASIWGFMF